MFIVGMRLEQLHQANLNLLVAFAVFAEELSVSAAAKRLLLSQPAASRTLQRLRSLFNDELLIRGARGYRLTPVGARLQSELNDLLPRLNTLLGQPLFDPAVQHTSFRIAGPDNVCSAIAPGLCREILPVAPAVHFDFIPWNSTAVVDLDRGHLDLMLSNDDVLVPAHLESQKLYEERWWCIVARTSPLPARLTLEHYLAANHIAVPVLDGVQTIPDKRLAAHGLTRNYAIRLPYFGSALECLPGTPLMLTVTTSIARIAAANPALRVLVAPAEITPFSFQMVWHPRLTSDAAHAWLRSTLLRTAEPLRAQADLS
jgi:DNA-binding transcriptional LysR family regulator